MSAHSPVVRAAYRSLLAWARSTGGTPISVEPAHVQLVAPGLTVEAAQDGRSLTKFIKQAFRESKSAQPAESSAGIDRALCALRLFHEVYGPDVRSLRAARSQHGRERQRVRYPLGTVFRHASKSYHAVVFGWDSKCAASEHAREPDVRSCDHDQPYYYVLANEEPHYDEGGKRSKDIVEYVAEENVVPTTDSTRIKNRFITHHFEGFSAAARRYLPNSMLRFEYPDTYDLTDPDPIAEDANLLAVHGPEDEAAPTS